MLLIDISKALNGKLIGNLNKNITHICSLNKPNVDGICFAHKAELLTKEIINSVGAILYPDNVIFPFAEGNTNLILVPDVHKSFADLSYLFKENSIETYKLSPLIGKNSKYGENCFFGSNVLIEKNVSIGNNVIIKHNVVIHAGTIIGNDVEIGAGTIIGSEGFGNHRNSDFSWSHINHFGNVIIEDNVRVGANCTIDKGTINSTQIKKGSIIDNQVHIAHNVVIGEYSAIAAKVGIAGSTEIGKRNMIGGMVGIVDHIKTVDDVIISATSTVTRDIKKPGTYTGIMPISYHSTWKRIALWITKLDKIAKYLNLKRLKL